MRFIRLGAAAALLASIAAGQSGTGTIQGTVQDPSNAIVTGAKISLTHAATNRVYEVVSNDSGFFTHPNLQVGDYLVTVDVNGFKKWEGSLTLQVGQTAVVNIALALGSAATEVTVAGDITPLVTTENATLGATLERSRLEQLPINGRMLNTLLTSTVPGADSSRIFGLREQAFDIVQDGAVLKNADTGTQSGRLPGLDSIQEFKVETNNSSARFNRPATATVVTKSGTNELHGAAFETLRNNAFGVARRRQDYYTKAPQLIRNEFGASMGGPVVLPKIYDGRNKTFFFGAYEGYRQRQANTVQTSVPTAAMRGGDFSGLVDSLGRQITLYDPWTTGPEPIWQRTPYPGNQIPLSKRSPLATKLYEITPLPTYTDRNPLVTNNYFGPGQRNINEYTVTTRLDHRLSGKDQIFFRITAGDALRSSISTANGAAAPTLDFSTNITYVGVEDKSGVLSWTRTFTPTLFSETLFTLSQEIYDVSTGTYGINHATNLGLPNPFGETGFPTITGTGFGFTYVQADTRRNSRSLTANIEQNFTWLKGRHEMNFGGKIRNDRAHVLPDQQYVSGNHQFSSGATALYDPSSGSTYSATPRTGHDSANLYLGVAGQYSAHFAQKWYRFRSREYALYFQDNVKVNSRLTLNYGLRWEMHPALHEADNLFTGFDPQTKAIVNSRSLEELYRLGRTTPEIVANFTRIGVKFTTPEQVGLPKSMVNPEYWDLGPRAGFAYKLHQAKRTTVLRGGYALFTFPSPLRNFDFKTRANAPFDATFTTSYTAAAQSPDLKPNYAMRSVPTVIAGRNSTGVIDVTQPGGVTRGSFETCYFNPDQPSTQSHQWNLTIEREILDGTVLRVGYVGNHASKLEQWNSYNDAGTNYVWFATTGLPLPTGEYAGVARRGFDQTAYGNIMEYTKTGWSNFNGMQVEVQRQYKKGYAFQFFYVMSNAFRVAGDGWRDDRIYAPDIYMPGAVPTDYDERNRFLNYRRDTGVPQHRFRWNWLVDLPFGKGKKFGGGASPLLDKLIGGWQLAGFGTYRSNYWSLPTTNWGYLGDVEVYGTKYKIEDCRSGACIPGYLYWNGYIPANRINSYDANGKPNGVMGVPANYKPSNLPTIPIPASGGSSSDPLSPYYDSNNVWVPMQSGTPQRIAMDTGLHPWRNQYIAGPWNFGLDASIFKNVKFGERLNLRFNADFFNVLNNPGMAQPGANGILSLQNSSNGPRELQLTLRLSW